MTTIAPDQIRVTNMETLLHDDGRPFINGDVLFQFMPGFTSLTVEVSAEAALSSSLEQAEASLIEAALQRLRSVLALPPEAIADLRQKGRQPPQLD